MTFECIQAYLFSDVDGMYNLGLLLLAKLDKKELNEFQEIVLDEMKFEKNIDKTSKLSMINIEIYELLDRF